MSALMIFRRDLRVDDNTALAAAAKHPQGVIPLFILDEALLQRWQAAQHRLKFMASCLKRLDTDIRARGGALQLASGNPAEVLDSLIHWQGISEVHVNADYTPWARRRDQLLQAVCDKHNVPLVIHADQLLHEPGSLLKADDSPYTVFTPWYRRACQLPVRLPSQLSQKSPASQTTRQPNLSQQSKPPERSEQSQQSQPSGHSQESPTSQLSRPPQPSQLGQVKFASIKPGWGMSAGWPSDRNFQDAEALDTESAMQSVIGLADYHETRDLPGVPGTSRLSAHLRFGSCSGRQVHQLARASLAEPESVFRQLHWRDFYHQIGYHYPHVYTGCFRQVYDKVQWDEPDNRLEQWCQGKTGFPIVDAGMRELMATGWMHNRVRMIVASFLTKNLHFHWQLGEAHFARYLIDYDPAVNNGNWQWCASTGCDAQPWFRIFNPWRQQRKFDPEAAYIKAWVPELAGMSTSEIHGLEKDSSGYMPQIADLKTSAEESKRRFKAVTA